MEKQTEAKIWKNLCGNEKSGINWQTEKDDQRFAHF